MGLEYRDYYNDGGSGRDYLSNPGSLLNFSLPVGRLFGASIRLTIWILIDLLFLFVTALHGFSPIYLIADALVFGVVLLAHEFAHRICADLVGGYYNEFLLWPAGSISHPEVGREPRKMLIAHGAGIAANALMLLFCGTLLLIGHQPATPFNLTSPWEWLLLLLNPIPSIPAYSFASIYDVLRFLVLVNTLLIPVNLLPYFWFDGGFLWEAALTPAFGSSRAIRITCLTGMILAGVGVVAGLYFQNILLMIMWVLLFADAFRRWQDAKFAGGFSGGFDYSSSFQPEPSPRKRSRWPARSAVKKAQAQRKEQEKIDAILSKVHASGMQSLNWFERRALQKATERQRRAAGG